MGEKKEAYILLGHGCNLVTEDAVGNISTDKKQVPDGTTVVTMWVAGESTSPWQICSFLLEFNKEASRNDLRKPDIWDQAMYTKYAKLLAAAAAAAVGQDQEEGGEELTERLHIHSPAELYVNGKFIPHFTAGAGDFEQRVLFLMRSGVFKLEDAAIVKEDGEGECGVVMFSWGGHKDNSKNLRETVREAYAKSVYPTEDNVLELFDEVFGDAVVKPPKNDPTWIVPDDIKEKWTRLWGEVEGRYGTLYSDLFERLGPNVYYILTCREACEVGMPDGWRLEPKVMKALSLQRQSSLEDEKKRLGQRKGEAAEGEAAEGEAAEGKAAGGAPAVAGRKRRRKKTKRRRKRKTKHKYRTRKRKRKVYRKTRYRKTRVKNK